MPIEVRGSSRSVRVDVSVKRASWAEYISY
jgi:hypothetical protein